MKQKMRNNKYVSLKINFQLCLLLGSILFCIVMTLLFVNQTRDINTLRVKSSNQNAVIEELESRISESENEKSNLEDQINDLEGRISDLEDRRIVVTYK